MIAGTPIAAAPVAGIMSLASSGVLGAASGLPGQVGPPTPVTF